MHQRRRRGSLHAVSLVAPVGALLFVCGACGSRGPLDVDIIQIGAENDASSTTPVVDSGQDVTTVVDAGPKPITDARAEAAADAPHEAGLVNCGLCVAQSCGSDIVACITDTACFSTLQCVATTCLGGGGSPDPSCFVTCGSGKSLVQILRIFRCITDTCGPDCGDLLGGLGGLGGGRMEEPQRLLPGNSPRDDAKTSSEKGAGGVGRVLFSRYPELCTKTE